MRSARLTSRNMLRLVSSCWSRLSGPLIVRILSYHDMPTLRPLPDPTTAGTDPVATANTMAAWVKTYNLDGIDVVSRATNIIYRPMIHRFVIE